MKNKNDEHYCSEHAGFMNVSSQSIEIEEATQRINPDLLMSGSIQSDGGGSYGFTRLEQQRTKAIKENRQQSQTLIINLQQAHTLIAENQSNHKP